MGRDALIAANRTHPVGRDALIAPHKKQNFLIVIRRTREKLTQKEVTVLNHSTTRRRKRTILTISYLAAAVAALGILAGVNAREANRWRRQAANQYRHAFHELVTAVGELDAALEKSMYATSPSMVNAVCTEVFGKAMTAQMSLGALPFSPETLERTSGFISRVGDYAYSLSRSAAAGQGYTPEQLDSLTALSETAGVLAGNLNELQTRMQNGEVRFAALEQQQRGLLEAQAQLPDLGESMRLIEQEFPEIPSLIYDGPFSEHLSSAAPRALEGMDEVDEEQARDAAARFLGLPRARVYPTGDCGGTLPCYGFAADGEGGSGVYLAVTKQGGCVLSMLSSRPVGAENVTAEAAVETAKQFLADAGYTDMAETYHMSRAGVLTVNFAWRQGEVLCYSDLVKVSVALDTGRVCGFEAKGYLTAHCRRELPLPSVDAGQARAAVPETLELLAVQQALVPSDGKYETLCWEFKCAAADGRHYIIYVDAVTGQQHKILILLEDESGTLTL